MFSLKLNTFKLAWELSSNSTKFWYASRFLFWYWKPYIDIKSFILTVKVPFWPSKFRAESLFHIKTKGNFCETQKYEEIFWLISNFLDDSLSLKSGACSSGLFWFCQWSNFYKKNKILFLLILLLVVTLLLVVSSNLVFGSRCSAYAWWDGKYWSMSFISSRLFSDFSMVCFCSCWFFSS